MLLGACAVVAVCSVIQGVFGIGLLVLGTPCLLLLGFPFTQALSYLLPCSIMVSFLQIDVAASRRDGSLREYLGYLLPAVALGAASTYSFGSRFDLRDLVGGMLLANACLRVVPSVKSVVARSMTAWRKPALVLIGSVHGLTNMGGGLLAVFVSARSSDKSVVRSGIAAGYLLMAIVQYLLLIALGATQGGFVDVAILMAVTIFGYQVIGRRLFGAVSHPVFEHLMTALIVVCGVLLIR